MSARARFLQSIPDCAPGELTPSEIYWRDHQPWLASRGYMLRPRYSPDWVPSWQGTDKTWADCEDGHGLNVCSMLPNVGLDRTPYSPCFCQRPSLLDATRIADGKFVYLKLIKKSVHPFEADIGFFFSSETLASKPRNHCVPIYEVLQLPDDDDKIILVMPLLREYYNPQFETVGEVVEFFHQVFEVREDLMPLPSLSDIAHRACNSFTRTMLHIGMSTHCSKDLLYSELT